MATKMFSRPLSSAFRATSCPSQAFASRFVPQPRLSPFAVRYLSKKVKAAIDKCIETSPVVLFMKGKPEMPQCGFSRATIQVLGLQGVDPAKFASFNVLEDEELRAGIKEYSEWPTIPQLYVNKEFVGGCDIILAMHQNGELAKMLEEKNVLVPVEGEGEGSK